jgi:antitoxin (DNA-binding transcriptional repressor) of toxin-antitoxin stability system
VSGNIRTAQVRMAELLAEGKDGDSFGITDARLGLLLDPRRERELQAFVSTSPLRNRRLADYLPQQSEPGADKTGAGNGHAPNLVGDRDQVNSRSESPNLADEIAAAAREHQEQTSTAFLKIESY